MVIVKFPFIDLKRHPNKLVLPYLYALMNNMDTNSFKLYVEEKDFVITFESDYKTIGRGFGEFKFEFTVTDEGIDRADEIVQLLFFYLNMIKNMPLIKNIFQDEKQLRKNKKMVDTVSKTLF